MSNRLKIKVNYGLFSEEDFIKDCPNDEFIPTFLPPVKRIIAMGDIHGDLDLAIKSFKLAKLIDDNLNWIADPADTVVVQVGDQIDSCRPVPGKYNCKDKRHEGDKAEDISVLEFFNNMHNKAARVGGAVYSLLGNHELMNSQGNFYYSSYENYHNFNYQSADGIHYEGPDGRKDAFKPGGAIATMLACQRMSILVIGSTMFVHAGVLPVLAKRLDSLNLDDKTKLKYLNAIVRKWLLKKLSDFDKDNIKLLTKNDKISPFWTRIYGSIPINSSLNSTQCFSSMKKILKVYKIGHLVVGHTPQIFANNEGINGTCYDDDGNNTLYRVDGGFSKSFKRFDHHSVQVLEIIDDHIFNILQ